MESSQESTAGNRLSFMRRRQGGHVVSWSLLDRATRLMLAHSLGRREINGERVDHDPNVAITADVMEVFFEDPTVEARLLALVDARVRGELEAERRRVLAELPATATAVQDESAVRARMGMPSEP